MKALISNNRYHATTSLAYIHRKRAIDYWSKSSKSEDMSLERALLCFDLFVMDDFKIDVSHVSHNSRGTIYTSVRLYSSYPNDLNFLIHRYQHWSR